MTGIDVALGYVDGALLLGISLGSSELNSVREMVGLNAKCVSRFVTYCCRADKGRVMGRFAPLCYCVAVGMENTGR